MKLFPSDKARFKIIFRDNGIFFRPLNYAAVIMKVSYNFRLMALDSYKWGTDGDR